MPYEEWLILHKWFKREFMPRPIWPFIVAVLALGLLSFAL